MEVKMLVQRYLALKDTYQLIPMVYLVLCVTTADVNDRNEVIYMVKNTMILYPKFKISL